MLAGKGSVATVQLGDRATGSEQAEDGGYEDQCVMFHVIFQLSCEGIARAPHGRRVTEGWLSKLHASCKYAE